MLCPTTSAYCAMLCPTTNTYCALLCPKTDACRITVQCCVQQHLFTVQWCVQQHLLTVQCCVQQRPATFKPRSISISCCLAVFPSCCSEPIKVNTNDKAPCVLPVCLSVREVLKTVFILSVCRFASLLTHHQTEFPLHSQRETAGPLSQWPACRHFPNNTLQKKVTWRDPL